MGRDPLRGLEAGEKVEAQGTTEPDRPAPKPRQEHFTLKQLQKATGNFNESGVVGRGSFGTVYRGVLPGGSVVAVKRLETRRGRRDIEEKSWRAEVAALGNVRHRNLVPLLGVCTERGERLLVLEFFPQGNLDRRLHRPEPGEAALTWGDRLSIARSVCQGLTYLHNHIRPPIVHRDIKAANVLLSDIDVACIADFGLAHLVQDAGGKTSTVVKGTVPYMAPEYLHGGARFLSPKCDVYSFGMLCLELVTGRPVVRQVESGVMEGLLKVTTDAVREGRLLDLVDPALGNNDDAEDAKNFLHVALSCVRTDPSARPTMEAVGAQLARPPVPAVNSSFDRGDDEWESEGSSAAHLGSASGSTGFSPRLPSGEYQSTVQVASRFVTPR